MRVDTAEARIEIAPFDPGSLDAGHRARELRSVLRHFGFEGTDCCVVDGRSIFSGWLQDLEGGAQIFYDEGLAWAASRAGLAWDISVTLTGYTGRELRAPDGACFSWVLFGDGPAVCRGALQRLSQAAAGDDKALVRALDTSMSRGTTPLGDLLAICHWRRSAARPDPGPGPRARWPGPSLLPTPAAYYDCGERRRVVVPVCDWHMGLLGQELLLPWACPTCGGPRGKPATTTSTDGGCKLEVSAWENPCGHEDFYADLAEEAKVAALVRTRAQHESYVAWLLGQFVGYTKILAGWKEEAEEVLFCSVELPPVPYGLLRRHLGDDGLDRLETELGGAIVAADEKAASPAQASPAGPGSSQVVLQIAGVGGQGDDSATWDLAPIPPAHLDVHQAEVMLRLVGELGPDDALAAAEHIA